ncbi:MAG TPA: sigma-70 family RNA polymerase sigma factor [Gemmatimonadaceae bacterium]|nr:sigma-70 family RNA polymerase sigma factor [Gemmatimonadaceae bacterium]
MRSPSQTPSASLESVVADFAEMVRRVAWRHRLVDADVDEVMQEVRIRLWRSHGTGTPGSEQIAPAPASYVYRTAVSAALDLIRRRRARRAGATVALDESGEAAGVATPEAPRGPDADLEASELAAQVARAIDTIPATRRPAVRMYLAGYPREEIATLMGWSEAKTRNLLYRGLADLRERLTEWGVVWETKQ